jgi:hypothetical protein
MEKAKEAKIKRKEEDDDLREPGRAGFVYTSGPHQPLEHAPRAATRDDAGGLH